MNLKQKIRKGIPSIGTWLTIPHQSVVEVLSTAGFEWITLDLEHAAIDVESAMNLIGHIQAKGMKALVRVTKNEEVIIKKMLDAGADGLIVPMVNSKEDAINMLDFIYYPPKGKRGVGLNRAQNWGVGFDEYQEKLLNEIIVIAQIEHINAIDNLEDILSLDDIDATLIGPYDLSASLGIPGKYDAPTVKEALLRYESTCDDMNKVKGAHVVQSDTISTIEKLKKGYSFLAYSMDFFFLGNAAREGMNRIQEEILKNKLDD